MTWETIRDALGIIVMAVIYIAFRRKRRREQQEDRRG